MTEAIQDVVKLISRLPGIGERTALRLTFFVLEQGRGYAQGLGEALTQLHDRVRRCEVCGNYGTHVRCDICLDPKRQENILCVVARVPDLMAIERMQAYRGRYHVTHALLSPLDGIGPEALDSSGLLQRVRATPNCEVILATPLSVEGEATALYLSDVLKDERCTLSRIASGIPHGGELEFTDRVTLDQAFAGRRDMR